MSNDDRGIKRFQTDVCEPALPPAEEKFCPTCIPNPDAIVPDWKLSDGEPFLNEKTCEYQISVMINEEGDYYTSKEIGNAMRKDNIPLPMILRSYVLPACRLLLRYYEKEETDQTVCAFPAVSGTIDPTAFMEPDWAVGDKEKNCMSIYSMMRAAKIPEDFLDKVIREVEVPIPNSDNDFFTMQIVDGAMIYQFQKKSEIDPDARPINSDGLELYAKVSDYDLGSSPAEPMKVLVSVPAYIFDSIPEAPEPETLDFSSKEEVILSGPRLKAMTKRLHKALKVYGRYQAYWWQTERASIYKSGRNADGEYVAVGTGEEGTAFADKGRKLERDSSGDPIGDPSIFYIMEYEQPVLKFLDALDTLLEQNGARLTSAPNFLGDRVEEIKIVFEPDEPESAPTEEDEILDEDLQAVENLQGQPDAVPEQGEIDMEFDSESGPLRIKAVWFKYNMCGWQKAKSGFKKFLEKEVVKDKTVVGYFSNLTDIDSDLMAKQTPGWLDFIVKYTYPPLQIRYENENLETRQNPIACVIDAAGGPNALRDYIFNTVMSMGDAIAYQFSKNACKLISQEQKRALGTLTAKEQKNLYRPTDYKFKEWKKGLEARANASVKKHYEKETKAIKAQGKQIEREDFKNKAAYDAAVQENRQEQKRNTVRESEAVAHPYRSLAMDAALKEFPLDNTLLGLFVDESDLRAFGLGALFDDPLASLDGEEENSKWELIKRKLDLCGITQLGLKAIQCLMGGVSADVAYGAIIKAALRAMDNTNFEKFFIGLPYEKQLEIQEKIKKDIGDLPPPWEWEPGPATIPREKYDLVTQEDSVASNNQKTFANDDKILQITDILLPEIQTKLDEVSGKMNKTDDKDKKESYSIQYEKLNKQFNDLLKERDKLNRQNKKLQAANEQSNNKIEKLNEYFGDLSSEDKDKMRIAVAKYKHNKKHDPEEKIKQGTIGKALGGIQKVLFEAYVDAILDTVGFDKLLSILDKFPGAKIIINAIAKLDCLSPPMIYPPVDSFLSTLTLDPCGPNRAKLTLPNIIAFGELAFTDLIKVLGQVFYKVLEQTILKVVVGAIVKILQILESALCKALEITGNLVANALSPGDQGGFLGAITDAFCGKDTDNDEEQVASDILAALGVRPGDLQGMTQASLYDSHKELMKTLGSVASINEFKYLLVGIPSEHDNAVLRRLSNAISVIHPEYRSTLGNPSNVSMVFAAAGNLLSPIQRQSIKDDLNNPDDDVPIDPSVCLTQEQLDQWNDDRRRLFENNGEGLTPEQAKDWVDKLNDRAQSDIIDAASLMANGIDGPMIDAINRLTDIENTGDPDCSLNNTAIQLDTPTTQELMEQAVEGLFKGLSIEFQKDLVGGGLFFRRNGIVDHILADSWGRPLRSHQGRARSTFIWPDWANDQESFENKKEKLKDFLPDFLVDAFLGDEGKGYFPDTVGIHLQKKLLEQDFSFEPVFEMIPERVFESTKLSFARFTDYEFVVVRPSMKKPDLVFEYRDTLGGNPDKFGYGFEIKYSSFLMGPMGARKKLGYQMAVNFMISTDSRETEPEDMKIEKGKVSKFNRMRFTVEDSYSPDIGIILKELESQRLVFTDGQKSLPSHVTFQGSLLDQYVKKIWDEYGYRPPTKMFAKSVFNYHSAEMYKKMRDEIMKPEGNTPIGFKFGYNSDSAVTYKDLLYVNPDADPNDEETWFYDKEEEEAILGKSATENPRVHFLDPEIHGGWYNWPKVYVEPFKYNGMLSVIQLMVPEIDGCQPKRSDFLDSKSLKDRQAKTKNQVKPDKRLEFDEDCVKKVPFDLIQVPNIHGNIDATVVATIRVYIAEFILRALPIFSTVQFNDDNYDNAISQVIIEEMSKHMSDEGRWYDWSYIRKYTYYLHFLEQVAQIVQRRVENGELEETEEMTKAFEEIREAQKRYVHISKTHRDKFQNSSRQWVERQGSFAEGMRQSNPTSAYLNFLMLDEEPRPKDFDYQVKMGIMIGFYGPKADHIARVKQLFVDNDFKNYIRFNTSRMNMTYTLMRRSAKIYTIHSVKKQCETLLKYLINEELNFYSNKLSETMNPGAHITNLSRYYIGASKSIIAPMLDTGLLTVEKAISGTFTNDQGEEEVVVSYERDVGDCIGVSKNVTNDNPLSSVDLPEYVKEHGGFVVQKYVKVVDKPADESEGVPDIIRDRPDYLKGIVNIDEFRKFVQEKLIDNEDFEMDKYYLSEVFGDAEIVEDLNGNPDGIVGSLGFKFGVRLCFVAPNNFEPPSAGFGTLLKAQRQKAFYLPPVPGFKGAAHMFPLAVFEKDVLDDPLSEIDWAHPNFGEDLRCYIDGLSNTPEFQMIFKHIFPLRRVGSLIGIYSYFGFLSSVGEDPSERTEDARKSENEDDDDVWREGLFDDTKHMCFRMFKSFYEADSWDFGWDWDFSFNFRLWFQDMFPSIFTNIDPSVRWWQRWRIKKTRPFDKDGTECRGLFGSVIG